MNKKVKVVCYNKIEYYTYLKQLLKFSRAYCAAIMRYNCGNVEIIRTLDSLVIYIFIVETCKKHLNVWSQASLLLKVIQGKLFLNE